MNGNRFEWWKALKRTALIPSDKVMAGTLALEFYNEETGQLNPSIATLANAQGVSRDTAKRSIANLINAGWLSKIVGRGRGNSTRYVLRWPGQVQALHPVTASKAPPKRGQDCTATPSAKGGRTAQKRVQGCPPHIMKEQSSEQRERASEARQMPAPHLRFKVDRGTFNAEAWGEWLWSHGLPSLDEMPVLAWDTGYCLTSSTPPTDSDATSTMIAKKRIDWAMNHTPKGTKHDRAA